MSSDSAASSSSKAAVVKEVQVRVEIVKLNSGELGPVPDVEDIPLDVNATVSMEATWITHSACPLFLLIGPALIRRLYFIWNPRAALPGCFTVLLASRP
jgi:hypothetical protein